TAQLIENSEPDEITQEILTHLQNAQTTTKRVLGSGEFTNLANYPINSLPRPVRRRLEKGFGSEKYAKIDNQLLSSFKGEDANLLIDELGRQVLTRTYRQILLRVIDSLWIEYLTQMESLRISVGLEAYAQRDPLVTYKSKASELFINLINDTRAGVVSRLFTYRAQTGLQAEESMNEVDTDEGSVSVPAEVGENGSAEVGQMGQPIHVRLNFLIQKMIHP
ncbi:MAG: hypothetical protein HC806_09305, partial [Anaerolineae bacterium]|nr:hypothetical protein [Anaerolineae bacterium]